jgi:FAD/FMN-containing dehydrogenase/short-subunit dehydrogenase
VTEVWRQDYLSWGRAIRARHLVSHPMSQEHAAEIVASTLPVLAYGCGRSYGDAPLNPGGRLIDCRGLDRFIAFDPQTGILTCEAGVLLADILSVLCRPDANNGGWFLPVVPGTRFVTVGGAIANDVHGKNHHRLGTFGRHVLALELARSDGTRPICSRDENAGLFAATIGGIGLTGLILNATIQLQRVRGMAVEAEDIRFGNLGEFFALVAESDAHWDYTAAWIDSFATGPRLGRGIFSRARRVSGRAAWPPASQPRTALPPMPPVSLIRPLTARAFNAAYWRKSGFPRRSNHTGSYENVLFPLDAIADWNRVYGPKGFFQFQCVVPPSVAPDAVAELLRLTAHSAQGSFVTGIKTFGDVPSPGLMSFPMAGTSLALDIPNRGVATRRFLAQLEQVVIQAGGRIYPAKDAAMSAASFRQGYPQISKFGEHIDPKFSSALARRLALTPATRSEPAPIMVSSTPSNRTVAIFGATSDIAMAVARLCAQAGDLLVLVGRGDAALSALAADLSVRGAAGIAVQKADFAHVAALPGVVQAAWERFGGIDVALIAYAVQPDQPAAEQDPTAAEAALVVNFVSPAILLGELARRYKARGSGTIAAITSVAGDRGRKSNYIYGAAKGGLHRFLEGLRHSLHAAGVNVLDIRPGFVATKLTAHLDRRGPLWATPDRVARDIFKAIASGRPVLYTPWHWWIIMVVVRWLPRWVFHRTSF